MLFVSTVFQRERERHEGGRKAEIELDKQRERTRSHKKDQESESLDSRPQCNEGIEQCLHSFEEKSFQPRILCSTKPLK